MFSKRFTINFNLSKSTKKKSVIKRECPSVSPELFVLQETLEKSIMKMKYFTLKKAQDHKHNQDNMLRLEKEEVLSGYITSLN